MKKQIIISGGLGNQMFQYAFYMSMKSRGINCEINTSLFDLVKMHNGFELPKVFGVKYCKTHSILSHFLVRFFNKYKLRCVVYNEIPYVLNSSVFQSSSIIFNGNWICEDYFKDIEDCIRSTFVFIGIDDRNSNLADELKTNNSVSIHIRRGDYLKLPSWSVCDENYYVKAINFIKQRVNDPRFYVFSDDPVWSESFMLKMNVPYIMISHNRGSDSYKDMYLMSCCKHNINANSTFSWWGAWLNNNKEKIVVMPKKWTQNTRENPACMNWTKL